MVLGFQFLDTGLSYCPNSTLCTGDAEDLAQRKGGRALLQQAARLHLGEQLILDDHDQHDGLIGETHLPPIPVVICYDKARVGNADISFMIDLRFKYLDCLQSTLSTFRLLRSNQPEI